MSVVVENNRKAMHRKITLKHIKQVAQRIAARIAPEQIILFGSYAHGRPNPDSDVDFLLVINGTSKAHRRRAYRNASDVLDPRPFPVDLVVRSRSDIRSRIAQGDFFLRDVFSYGRVLYER